MQTLFEATDRQSILDRLAALRADSPRQWGKMSPGQMLTHCAIALEMACGDRPMKQKLIGKLLAPLVKKGVLGEKDFSRNSPTDPTFVVSDERDVEAERKRLVAMVEKFSRRGPAEAARQTHPFFGKMTGDEWGVLMAKHLDHHLKQFGC